MKTLAKKILILFIPMISLLVIMLLIIIKSDFKFDDINKNVDDLIQKQNNSDTVIIGDSVSYQLFINNDNLTCLSSRIGTTMIGYYIQLSEYLISNPQTKNVILNCIPENFVSIFQINHIYESFIIPYFNQNNYKYIEQDEIVYFEKLYPKYSQNVNFKKILAFNTAFLSKIRKQIIRIHCI